jgi:hypothetical protein
VSDNISHPQEETTEAVGENRREPAEETARINAAPGLSGVGDGYRERHPKAARAWQIHVTGRRAAGSRQALLGGALPSAGGPS